MRKLVLVAVVVIVALGAWLALPRGRDTATAPALAPAVDDARAARTAIEDTSSGAVESPSATSTRTAAGTASPDEASDLPPGHVRVEIVVQVVTDPAGEPIPGAEVRVDDPVVVRATSDSAAGGAQRRDRLGGIGYAGGDEARSAVLRAGIDRFVEHAAARPGGDRLVEHAADASSTPACLTNASGEATLSVIVREGERATVRVRAMHRDHAPAAQTVLVEPPSVRAVLCMRDMAALVVSGWVGEASNVVRGVVPRASDSAQIGADDWRPTADGRLATSRVASGQHAIALSWTSPQGARYESDVASVRCRSGERQELVLELHPHSALVGRLDDAVPRPVSNGEVAINVDFGGRGLPGALRESRAKIASDGSFRFDSLPRGRAQLVAMCDGWVSRDVPANDAYDAIFGATSGSLASGVRGDDTDGKRSPPIHPYLVLPSSTPLVVEMQRTASLEITVLGPDDAPVAGATVDVPARQRWRNGFTKPFLDRTWSARTDASGRALLVDLPPRRAQHFEASSDEPRAELSRAERQAAANVAELVSGETTRRTVRLTADPADAPR